MRQAGRQSAKFATVTPIPGQRPRPPASLTAAQAEIWRAVVATKPSTWFTRDAYPMLADYCRHAQTLEDLAVQINAGSFADAEAIKHLDRLLMLRDRESKILLRLATSMRLTNQSRISRDTAGVQVAKAGDGDMPWQQQA